MKHAKKRWMSLLIALAMMTTIFVPAVASAATWTYPTEAKKLDSYKDIATVAAHNAAVTAPEFLGANLVTITNPVASTGDANKDFETAKTKPVLGIFGTSINENADPYLWNYYYNLYANANGKTPTSDEDQVYGMPGFSPMQADTTIVEKWGTSASIYLKPDILLGTNADKSNANYETMLEAAKKTDKDRYENYDPSMLAYNCGTMSQMMDTMYQLAKAMKKDGKTGRYGDPEKIAKAYETYIKGIQFYIQAQIKAGKTKKKTVAIVDPTSSSDGGKFTAYTSNVASGTAASCRAAEYLENTTTNLIDKLNLGKTGDAYKVTPKQLLQADAIYITGMQGGSMTEDEFISLMKGTYGIDSDQIPPIYAKAPAVTYGIVMNSVENGMGFGLFQGFLYSDIINPVYATAYFYENFYHVTDNSALQSAIANNFEDATLPSGMNADIKNYTSADFQAKLDAGMAYYAANKASIDKNYPKLVLTNNLQLAGFTDTTGITLNKTNAELKINETVALKATVSPSNATDQGAEWTSSNDKVAAVDESGLVTAKSAGTAVITAKASGGQKAECKVMVKAEAAPLNLSGATVSKIADKAYTGKRLKPAVTVKLNGKTLKNGTDYTAAYKNNINPGKATVTITGKGNYTGKKTASFQIKPKKAVVSKVRSYKKGTLKVSWKRDKKASGYYVTVAKNKKFTKGKKAVVIKKNKTTAKTFKKLSKGKKYYAKVRAYKTISGKKVYGSYSKIKSAKVKR